MKNEKGNGCIIVFCIILALCILVPATMCLYDMGYNVGIKYEKEHPSRNVFVIDLDKFPYDKIQIKREEVEYAGWMDVELTPEDLWAVGYYYKTYGHNVIEGILCEE